jgi:hypothetical protein
VTPRAELRHRAVRIAYVSPVAHQFQATGEEPLVPLHGGSVDRPEVVVSLNHQPATGDASRRSSLRRSTRARRCASRDWAWRPVAERAAAAAGRKLRERRTRTPDHGVEMGAARARRRRPRSAPGARPAPEQLRMLADEPRQTDARAASCVRCPGAVCHQAVEFPSAGAGSPPRRSRRERRNPKHAPNVAARRDRAGVPGGGPDGLFRAVFLSNEAAVIAGPGAR